MFACAAYVSPTVMRLQMATAAPRAPSAVSHSPFPDWFSASARRVRTDRALVPVAAAPTAAATAHASTASHPGRKAPLLHRRARARPVRPDDWFSVEARVLRPQAWARPTEYAANGTEDNDQSRRQRQTPISSPPRSVEPPTSRLAANEIQAAAAASLPFSTARKRHAVRHKSDSHNPSLWMATEIRRLALSADEAAALCHHARHRTATGLLWVVASAAAGCTFRGSRLRHSNMPTFQSTRTATASNSRTGSSTSPTTAGIGGLARDDLLQEGAAALLHALDRWDPNRGRITTYSYLCAKYAMLRAIDNHARTIRLPVHAQEKLRRLVAARENLELRDRLSEYTGPAEAQTGCRKTGHPAEKGASIYSALPDRRRRRSQTPTISLARVAAEAGVPLREAAVLLQHAKSVLSTDAPLGDNEGTSLHDVLVDHRMNVAEAVEYSFMAESLAQLVRTHSGLEERERMVLLLRYGLHAEGTPIVARIVADRLGISLYKVRVAERNAIAKLRDDLQGLERDSYHEWMTSF